MNTTVMTGSTLSYQLDRGSNVSNDAQDTAAQSAPVDTVSISKGTRTGCILKGIAMFPLKVLETATGVVTGTAGAALHALPGMAEGVSEALTKESSYVHTGAYTTALVSEFTLGGAWAGFSAGGPVGAGIGAATGLFTGAIFRHIAGKTGFAHDFCQTVEKRVDSAIKDNVGISKAQQYSQDITEGTIVGGAVGMMKAGVSGYEAGKGIVDGLRNVAEGIIEGIEEAIRHKDRVEERRENNERN